jgi:hypothetical protein
MLTVQQYAKGATIPQKYLANAQVTIGIVNEIFNQFPNQFTFNSGYRTPTHNAAVGGVPNSFHVQALAADVTPKNGNYNQYKSALTSLVAKYGWELIDERNKNHFHIEPSRNGASLAVDNRQLPSNSYQSSNFSAQFSSISPQNQVIAVGVTFLVLYLLLSD